jgi:hypothetical protein
MRILPFFFIFMTSLLQAQQVCDCDSTFDFVYSQWASVDNMEYLSVKNERKMDEYETAEFEFTVQRKPYKVAGLMIGKGHRLLYDPSLKRDEALYIPSGFPFTNVWLDIHGKVFRGLNHYTISNAGGEFIFGIIKNEYEKMRENFICTKVQRNGEWVIDVYAESDNYRLSPYTAQPRETVLDIAQKFNVMAYALIEYNQNVENYTEDLGGKKLMIPNQYGSKVKLAVSAEHGMPTLIRVEDPNGLLEQYEYSNYKFNQKLPADYFTEDYLDNLD